MSKWIAFPKGEIKSLEFAAAAKRTGQSLAAVISVYMELIDYAMSLEGDVPINGSIEGFDSEGCDAVLSLPFGSTNAIIRAFTDKGLIHEEGRLARWTDYTYLSTETFEE